MTSKQDITASLRSAAIMLQRGEGPEPLQAPVQSRVWPATKSSVASKVKQMAEQPLEVLQHEHTQMLIHSFRDGNVTHTTPEEADEFLQVVIHCSNGAPPVEELASVHSKVAHGLSLMDTSDVITFHNKLRELYEEKHGVGSAPRKVGRLETKQERFRITRFMLQALVVVRLSAMEGNTRVVTALLLFAGQLGEFLGEGFELGAEVVSAALYKLEVGGCLISVTTPPNNGQEGRHYEPTEFFACKTISVDAQLGVEEAKPLGLLDRTAFAVETLALNGDPEPWKSAPVNPNAYMAEVLHASLEKVTPNKVAMCQKPKATYLGMRSALVESAFNIIVYVMMKKELAARMALYNALAEGPFKEDLTKLLDSRKGWRTSGHKTTRSKEKIVQDCTMVAAYYAHPLSFCGAQAPVMFKMLSENRTDDPVNIESQFTEMIVFAHDLCEYLFEPTYCLVELMNYQDSQYLLGNRGVHDHRVSCAAAKSTWRKMLREFALVQQLVDQYTKRPAKIDSPNCLVAHQHPEAAVRETSLNDLCVLLAKHSAFGGRVQLCAAVGSPGTFVVSDDRQYYFPELSLAEFAPKFGLVTGPPEAIEFEPLEAFFDKVSPLVASLPPWARQPPAVAAPAATVAATAELQTERNLCQNPETALAPVQVIDSSTPKKVVQAQPISPDSFGDNDNGDDEEDKKMPANAKDDETTSLDTEGSDNNGGDAANPSPECYQQPGEAAAPEPGEEPDNFSTPLLATQDAAAAEPVEEPFMPASPIGNLPPQSTTTAEAPGPNASPCRRRQTSKVPPTLATLHERRTPHPPAMLMHEQNTAIFPPKRKARRSKSSATRKKQKKQGTMSDVAHESWVLREALVQMHLPTMSDVAMRVGS